MDLVDKIGLEYSPLLLVVAGAGVIASAESQLSNGPGFLYFVSAGVLVSGAGLYKEIKNYRTKIIE